MSVFSVSLPPLPGLIQPWVGVDVDFYTVSEESTLDAIELTLRDVSTDDVVVRIHDDTVFQDVTIPTGSRYAHLGVVGKVFPASSVLKLQVVSAPGGGMNLSGTIRLLTTGTPSSGVYLTNLALVKMYLNEPGSALDNRINAMIPGISKLMEGYMARSIIQERKTEYHVPTLDGPIIMDDWPVDVSDTGSGDGVFRVTTDGLEAVAASDFTFDAAALYRVDGDLRVSWALGVPIQVQGLMGYPSVPSDLEHAATIEVCRAVMTARDRKFGVESEGHSDGTQKTWSLTDFLPETMRAMQKYQKRW